MYSVDRCLRNINTLTLICKRLDLLFKYMYINTCFINYNQCTQSGKEEKHEHSYVFYLQWEVFYLTVSHQNQVQVITGVCVILQATQFSSRRHEVYGQILSPDGKVVHNLFGKWNEALYYGHAPSSRCIWRPGQCQQSKKLTDHYCIYVQG